MDSEGPEMIRKVTPNQEYRNFMKEVNNIGLIPSPKFKAKKSV